MGVAEGQHADAGDQADHRIGALTRSMVILTPGKNIADRVGIAVDLDRVGDLVGQHVQQDFGIRGGAQMAAVFAGDLFALLVGVGDVAVVNQVDPVGRVHEERLGFGGSSATRQWGSAHGPCRCLPSKGLGMLAALNTSLTRPFCLALAEVHHRCRSRCPRRPGPGAGASAARRKFPQTHDRSGLRSPKSRTLNWLQFYSGVACVGVTAVCMDSSKDDTGLTQAFLARLT